jgi:hypothetical protein
MGAGAVEHDAVAHHPVHQQPVCVHVALGEAGVPAGQGMFPERRRKSPPGLEEEKDVLERLVVERVPRQRFLQAAEISFEAPREAISFTGASDARQRPLRF